VDGIHDLGGMQGFGRVETEPDEPVFHDDWEGRSFALAGGAMGTFGFNTPMFRHAIERMDTSHYLNSSYYEHWLTALATLLVETDVISRDELEGAAGPFPLSRRSVVESTAIDVPASKATPRYSVGDGVRVLDIHFSGHTRCPRYVRRRRGVVVRVDAAAPLPELEAHRQERVLDHTYGVRFDIAELWGGGPLSNAAVHVDLYEHYLEPA
jgi:nitrile hydratase beta subunit